MRLVLTNGLDAWLQLGYSHMRGHAPLERAHARPLALPPCLSTLANSPVSPVPTTLPGARAGGWIRRWGLPAAQVGGCSCGNRVSAAVPRVNARVLAP